MEPHHILNSSLSTLLSTLRTQSSTPQSLIHALPTLPITSTIYHRTPILQLLSPVYGIVQSEETTGSVTAQALWVLERYLRCILMEWHPNAKRIMRETLKAVKHCQFEVTDPATDESALMRILDVFVTMIGCRGGILLESEEVVDIMRSVLRIGRETRPSELLRQASERALHRIVEILWSRLLQQDSDATEESPSGTSGSVQKATSPTAASSSSPSSPSSSQHKRTLSTSSTTNSPHHNIHLVFEFIYELANPLSNHGAKSTSLRILGTSLCNLTLETLGPHILKYPSLVDRAKNQLFRILLINASSTPNTHLLQLTLRTFHSAVLSFPNHLHDQIEVFLLSTHIHISGNKKSPFEQQQLILESLIELFSEGNFPLFLYHHYDCSPTSSNLFELLCNFLCKKVKESDERLNTLHILALKALLAIVNCLHDRCDLPGSPANVSASTKGMSGSNTLRGVGNDHPTSSPTTGTPHTPTPYPLATDTAYKIFRQRREQKKRMMDYAEEISKNPVKGVKRLRASKFLSDEEDASPKLVARFLWDYRNWMSQTAVGEVLRENKDYFVKVLDEYMEFFDFSGLRVDQALRHMTSTFFLTGEGQQIQRILERFSDTYFRQNPHTYLTNQDNVWMFAVAIIMLHSDLHKPQNPNKMSLDDFRQNTTNSLDDGIEVPDEDLEDIYYSISKTEMETVAFSSSFKSDSAWHELVQRSERYLANDVGSMIANGETPIVETPEKSDSQTNNNSEPKSTQQASYSTSSLLDIPVHHDAYMFERLWSSASVAIRIVLDSTDDEKLLNIAIGGLKQASRVAAHYGMTKAFDNFVISLCKFTMDLSPHRDNSIVLFGENSKAQLAARTVFAITRIHGGSLREGWKNILDLILRIYELELLPEDVLLEREEYSLKQLKTYVKPKKKETRNRSSSSAGSFWGGFWGGSNVDDSLLEEEARKKTVECIEQCRIPDLLNEAKFLHAPSLEYLVKALIICGQQQQNIDVYSCMFCLDLLTDISISNKHRLEIVWKFVIEFLANMLSGVCTRFKQNANRMKKREHIVLENTVLAMLRLYIHLLPERGETSDAVSGDEEPRNNAPNLAAEQSTPATPASVSTPSSTGPVPVHLRSKMSVMNIHQLIYYLSVSPQVLAYVLPQICSCIEILVREHAAHIRDAKVWEVLFGMLRQGVTHQEALKKSIEVTTTIVENHYYVSPQNIPTCVHTLMNIHTKEVPSLMMKLHTHMLEQFPAAENNSSTAADTNRSPDAEGSFIDSLSVQQQEWFDSWICIGEGLGKLCTSIDRDVRSNSFSILQKLSLSPQLLQLPPEMLLVFFERVHFVLMDELFSPEMSQRSAEMRPVWEEALFRATNLLNKTYLHLLPVLVEMHQVDVVWIEVLQRMKEAMKSEFTLLREAVPELIKNMYLVMETSGIPSMEDPEAEVYQKTRELLSEGVFADLFGPEKNQEEEDTKQDAPPTQEATQSGAVVPEQSQQAETQSSAVVPEQSQQATEQPTSE